MLPFLLKPKEQKMRKLLLFVTFLVSTSVFSQIPASLEVTLPWEIIYTADCQSAAGERPTTINETVFITTAPEVITIQDSEGNCIEKILTYKILDWVGNATYTFIQFVKVNEMYTLEGVSDVTITYDELPYPITVSDLVVNADPNHTYSFDISEDNHSVFIYDHDDRTVAEVNIIITDCEEEVVIDVPGAAVIEFSGAYYIPFTAELFDINIVYPCGDYELSIKRGGANGLYDNSIGSTVDVVVKVKITSATPIITYTKHIMVTVIGEGPTPIPMYIEEKTFAAGEEITLDVWSDQLDGLLSIQLRLNFENAQILALTEGSPFDDIPHNIFNDAKTINSLWIPWDVQPIDVTSNETWFTLTVLPSIDGSTLDIFTTVNDPWSEIVIEDSISIIGVSADFNFEIAERNFLVSNEELEHDNLLIHNNPVSDRLVVSGFTQDMDISQVSIFSFDGRQVMSKPFDRNSDKLDLDIARLGSGIYLLRLNGSTPQTIRFVKI
jgi:hypothetical protein